MLLHYSTHKDFKSHLSSSATTNLTRLSATENWLVNELQFLVKTLDLTRGKRSFQRCFNFCVTVETRYVTADAVTWPLSTLASSKRSQLSPDNKRWEVMRGDARLVTVRQSPARHGENTASSTAAQSRERASMSQFLHGVNTPHFSLLKAIRPEQPNGLSPFLSSIFCACDVCDRRHLPSCCSVSSAAITFKPLHPLPP
jgi:hypothetical protein